MCETVTIRIEILREVNTLELTFAREKETKNTVRFEAQGFSPVRYLYVDKGWLAGNGNPDTLTVTLAAPGTATVEVPKTAAKSRAKAK